MQSAVFRFTCFSSERTKHLLVKQGKGFAVRVSWNEAGGKDDHKNDTRQRVPHAGDSSGVRDHRMAVSEWGRGQRQARLLWLALWGRSQVP